VRLWIFTELFVSSIGGQELFFEGFSRQLVKNGHSVDIVLATKMTLWAKDIVNELIEKFGLCARAHIEERMGPPREAPSAYRADVSHLGSLMGRAPRRIILEVLDSILRTNHPEAWSIAGRNQ